MGMPARASLCVISLLTLVDVAENESGRVIFCDGVDFLVATVVMSSSGPQSGALQTRPRENRPSSRRAH